MGFYKGITKKKMKDGSFAIMARFKHQGITYPVKNLTKLYGVKTEKGGFEKLAEIRNLLSQNIDPFVNSDGTLNDLFYKKVELNERNQVWASSTIKNRLYFYNKHIKDSIGKMKIEKIKYEDVMKIIDKFTLNQPEMKNQIIDILRPIFKEETRKGILLKNIMNDVPKYFRTKKRIDISQRTHISHTDIVQKLYKAIAEYDQANKENIEQHKMFLYMILLTAHRYNEVNLLEKKHCDLKRKIIIAPKEITKTNCDYHYPIPDEVYEYIKNHEGGRLFNVPRGGTAGRIFHRILIKAKIETINDYSLSMHDTRRLMTSIMVSKLNIDSRLADYCLEHKEQNTIKHYLEFIYEDKVEAYEKYWHYIRTGEIKAKSTTEANKQIDSNDKLDYFQKLEKLVNMYEKNLITKEEFEIAKSKLF